MWAYMKKAKEYPAHFGSRGIVGVIEMFVYDDTRWVFSKDKEKYLVLPKDLIVWQNQ